MIARLVILTYSSRTFSLLSFIHNRNGFVHPSMGRYLLSNITLYLIKSKSCTHRKNLRSSQCLDFLNTFQLFPILQQKNCKLILFIPIINTVILVKGVVIMYYQKIFEPHLARSYGNLF